MPSVKNQDKGTLREFLQMLMRIKQKANSVHLLQMEKIGMGWNKWAVSEVFVILEREGAISL